MRNVNKLHFSVISLKNENENSSSTTENIIFTANFTDAKVCLQNLLYPASLSCCIFVNLLLRNRYRERCIVRLNNWRQITVDAL